MSMSMSLLRSAELPAPKLLPHQALRSATAKAHSALEARLPLMSTKVRCEQVALYLACLSPLLDDLETYLSPLGPALAAAGVAFDPAQSAARRQRDLAQLPRPPADHLPNRTGQRRWLDGAQDEGTRWGVLYVLEGSKLGGQVIGKHLERTLQLSATTGLSYFLAPPSQPLYWRRLCRVVDCALHSSQRLHAACQGAQACFSAFSAALSPLLLAARPSGASGRP